MNQSSLSYSRLETGLAARGPLNVTRPSIQQVSTEPPSRIEAWVNEGGAREMASAKTLRVLVVEDDALIGILLAETLEGMGYDVCAIEATEADAVIAAKRCKPGLMVVDAWLIDGTGIAAVEKILRTGFIPHLFVSGDVAKVKPLRPDAVMLQKPFNEADLHQAIQRALGHGAVS